MLRRLFLVGAWPILEKMGHALDAWELVNWIAERLL